MAADYRINTYFRDTQGVWVNLYLPSTVRWNQAGAAVWLTQESQYPFDSVVQFKLKTSQARDFTLNFRIPAWARGASISVNGRRLQTGITPGTFAGIRREWNSGDRIELSLPMTNRLEPIDRQHPQTVALLCGPLVLFAVTDSQPTLTRADLLAAQRLDRRSWQVSTSGAPLKLLPFTDIGDEQYSTYLRVS